MMLKPPGTHMEPFLGGTECHGDVARARKETSAADPEGLHCTKNIKLSTSWPSQFLKKQMSLNCRISGTVYCGRLREVPLAKAHHAAMYGLSLHWWLQEQLGRWWAELPGCKWTDCRGLRNTTVSSRSAEASARVNSPHYTPRAAFSRPEELHKYLTPFMKKKKGRDSRSLQRVV